jgi:hypothetical protein
MRIASPEVRGCGCGSTLVNLGRAILGGFFIPIPALGRPGMVLSWRIVCGEGCVFTSICRSLSSILPLFAEAPSLLHRPLREVLSSSRLLRSDPLLVDACTVGKCFVEVPLLGFQLVLRYDMVRVFGV